MLRRAHCTLRTAHCTLRTAHIEVLTELPCAYALHHCPTLPCLALPCSSLPPPHLQAPGSDRMTGCSRSQERPLRIASPFVNNSTQNGRISGRAAEQRRGGRLARPSMAA